MLIKYTLHTRKQQRTNEKVKEKVNHEGCDNDHVNMFCLYFCSEVGVFAVFFFQLLRSEDKQFVEGFTQYVSTRLECVLSVLEWTSIIREVNKSIQNRNKSFNFKPTKQSQDISF